MQCRDRGQPQVRQQDRNVTLQCRRVQGKLRISTQNAASHSDSGTLTKPKWTEQSDALRKLRAASPVFVYRMATPDFEGPLTFVLLHGESAIFQMPRRRRILRATCIRSQTKSDLPQTGLEGPPGGPTQASIAIERKTAANVY